MALSRERKEELVAHYSEMISQSQAMILTEYRGLTDKQLKAVRERVREANGSYHVTKVTLLKRALQEHGFDLPEAVESLPIAIGFCFDDMPGVAKVLTDYAKDVDLMIIRGGLMGERFLSEEEIKAIAKLPPLDVLRAQLIGLLDAPAANLVGVIQAGVSQVVNVLHAYSEQTEDTPA
ncbi:MAG: 50S ribosomal protein L10 [Anaerolineae bacterium]|nr:50S ribosomal protein L10 [Anaerolineae bacterium]